MNTQTYISNGNKFGTIELTAQEVLDIAKASPRFEQMRRQYPLSVVIASEAVTVERDGEEYHMAEGMAKAAVMQEIEKLISA